MTDHILSQISTSAMIVYGLEWLKMCKWFRWLDLESKKLNRIVAVILSGLGAIGVHGEFDPGAGTLLITGLSTVTILHGLWDWAQAFVTQQVIYDGVVQKSGGK